MSFTRLPAATAQIFPQTPTNVGPGSYETLDPLAARVAKSDTFPNSKLPHGNMDGEGNAYGDKVWDPHAGEYYHPRPAPLEPRTGNGGSLQTRSKSGGALTKQFSARARNLSGVRNRLKRFTMMHPSTQDVDNDPAPAVGTYEPTSGTIAEHKVDRMGASSMQDKSWRYNFAVGGSTGCWRNRNTVGFWDMPRKQLVQYEKSRATYDLDATK